MRALPAEEYERLRPHLERVRVGAKEVLYRPNEPIEHVYFPQTGAISLLAVMDDDSAVEVGTVGPEGMAGLSVFLGADAVPSLVMGQIPGESERMSASALREAVNRDGQLRTLLQLYTHTLLVQVFQGAACNRLHSVEERCARWILMTHDRADADEFSLTQEFLSYKLGVRRAGVSVAVGILEKAGFIAHRRGRIGVLDRQGLESAACECYRIIMTHSDRLLG